MILVLKSKATDEQIDALIKELAAIGVNVVKIEGAEKSILGLVGNTAQVDSDHLMAQDFVESVKRVSEPYKNANRKFHPEDSIIQVCDKTVGGLDFTMIAGPCSVECEDQIMTVAREVKKSGATMLRGGAFKPRTSPYAFQGLHGAGIDLLLQAKKETGLPIVTEIMSLAHIEMFRDVDVIQVGARNMQNFELLKVLGQCDKPILLKRGLANTIEEFLMSAEYIMAGGNNNVILCERGIRTFETMTRNTLDLAAVSLIKQKSHLPIIVDPSHATGLIDLILPMSLASIACGADGLAIEVHNNPKVALSDGAQSLTPKQFEEMMAPIKAQVKFSGKNL